MQLKNRGAGNPDGGLFTPEQFQKLREVHPQLSRYIGPPCHLRAGITTPICTEGSHFCGVKVWLDFPNTPRRI